MMEFSASRCSLEEEGGLLKKGPWTAAEDAILVNYVKQHGEGNWNAVQKYSGLSRCGKSCRLRWANHLRPNLKKGPIDHDEERKIIELHAQLGNKWAKMATQLPGRTDNEIKNFWNTRKKRMERVGKPGYSSEVKTASRHRQRMDIRSLSSSGESESEIVSSPGIEFGGFNQRASKPNLGFPMRSLYPLMGLHDMSASSVAAMQQVSSFGSPIRRVKRLRDGSPGHASQAPSSETFPRTGFFLDHPRLLRMESVSQSFPYDPDPDDLRSVYKGLSTTGYAFGSGSFSSTSRPVSNLHLELPSVQLSELADATRTLGSTISSPFLLCQVPSPLPAEGDSFACSGGYLLEAILHQKISPAGPLDIADQLSVLASRNESADTTGAFSSPHKVSSAGDVDPLSTLGGCSLSLLNQEVKPSYSSKCDLSSCTNSPLETAVKQEVTSEHATGKVKMEMTGAAEHLLDRAWAERLEDLIYFESETLGPVMEFCNAANNVAEGLQTSGGYLNSLDAILTNTQEATVDPGTSPLWETYSSQVWNYMPGAG